jgi:two-component system response regulator MprA
MKSATPTYALVADDDDDWRELIATALRNADMEVLATSDGEQLVSDFMALQARGETPAVVISDVEMPRRGGIEVTAALRSASEDVPIVLLTGLRDPALPSIAESAGASVVLTKPIAPRTLSQRVTALISSRRA